MNEITVLIFLQVGLALIILWRIEKMLDFTKLNAALAAIAASVQSVADAIRNPQVDNNSQAAIDEFAGRLTAVADGLTGLAAEETAMDTADAIAAEPPASEPIEPPLRRPIPARAAASRPSNRDTRAR